MAASQRRVKAGAMESIQPSMVRLKSPGVFRLFLVFTVNNKAQAHSVVNITQTQQLKLEMHAVLWYESEMQSYSIPDRASNAAANSWLARSLDRSRSFTANLLSFAPNLTS